MSDAATRSYPDTETMRRRIELARAFIAKEFADPTQEPRGDWISPDAKPAHDALCLCLEALSVAQTEQGWKSLYENAVRKHIECDAEIGKEMASLRSATIEECAQIAEAQKKAFLSSEYASNQPMGSFCERFACDEVANAIRALSFTSTSGGTAT